MKPIDRNKVYIFFWGTNSTLGPSTEARRVDLFDTSGTALGSVYFYSQGATIPNDFVKDGQTFMHRPLSDYESLMSFIQKSTDNIYFTFDSAGNDYGLISNHLY